MTLREKMKCLANIAVETLAPFETMEDEADLNEEARRNLTDAFLEGWEAMEYEPKEPWDQYEPGVDY